MFMPESPPIPSAPSKTKKVQRPWKSVTVHSQNKEALAARSRQLIEDRLRRAKRRIFLLWFSKVEKNTELEDELPAMRV
ncbi:hypothetical protein MMC16_000207 [Acarospora aff. strigata]|nr:hypothetical protein [Acarospora aff. strigata]